MSHNNLKDDAIVYGFLLGAVLAVATWVVFIHFNHGFIGFLVCLFLLFPLYMLLLSLAIEPLLEKTSNKKSKTYRLEITKNPKYQFNSDRVKNAAKALSNLIYFKEMEMSLNPYALPEAGNAIRSKSYVDKINEYNSDYHIYYHIILEDKPYYSTLIAPYFSSSEREKHIIEMAFTYSKTEEQLAEIKKNIDLYDLFNNIMQARCVSNNYIITYTLPVDFTLRGKARKVLIEDANIFLASNKIKTQIDKDGDCVFIYNDDN